MKSERCFLWTCALFAPALAAVMLLCICVGSVSIPLGDTLTALLSALTAEERETLGALLEKCTASWEK